MKTDIGKLLLRVMVGGLMLFHGIAKLLHGIDFIKGTVAAKGLPEIMAYGVYVGEVIAPLMLLIGFRSRLAGLIVALDMLMALFLVHAKQFFDINEMGGYGLELQMFYLFSSIVIVLLGSGKYAVKVD